MAFIQQHLEVGSGSHYQHSMIAQNLFVADSYTTRMYYLLTVFKTLRSHVGTSFVDKLHLLRCNYPTHQLKGLKVKGWDFI